MYAPISLAALAALVPYVVAHGHLDVINVAGKDYAVTGPSWVYNKAAAGDASWRSGNQDNGFVPSDAATLASNAVACHKRPSDQGNVNDGALPATGAPIPVNAGDQITVTWDQWPDHPGPTLDYLAKCPGACADLTDASSLQWFKIRESGLRDGAFEASSLSKNNLQQKFTIPTQIANGEYVARHEIIALHGAGSDGGAQLYPQCFNIVVSGGGSLVPEGTPGNQLYTSNDPGIKLDIYNRFTSYDVPGPWVDPALRATAMAFKA
ncbi:hypothetical protein CAC42_2471 [Sphaceloma murrayae]|uniref:AA9 family lytic polysaccharide monooxygenase n=1 Tax=Sphaceloma murrayae TaxID=2082308 RepID=A0A2K1QW60_9PEZI|nr:hypothetical protein CAC42_2471 [Sphaceloma murrayae]